MPRQITPEMVHPTHDVREEGIYISDPRCQICRVSAVEGDTERLLEPCDPNRRSKISAISTAMTAIIDERIRQIEAEGWTPDHDDAHGDKSLALAAACYALLGAGYRHGSPPLDVWPWEGQPKAADPRRNLVKAGALIVAEIERLDRAALRQAGEV